MIEVNNLTTNRADKNFLKKVAKKVLAGENKKIELSIALVGQARIKKLNKKYRKQNRATDVLSFLYDNSGEIVICLREVKKNARKFNSTYKRELARVLIHGLLHILAYSHQAMRGKEDYYLSKTL
jgi:probable rRNA maturation factor